MSLPIRSNWAACLALWKSKRKPTTINYWNYFELCFVVINNVVLVLSIWNCTDIRTIRDRNLYMHCYIFPNRYPMWSSLKCLFNFGFKNGSRDWCALFDSFQHLINGHHINKTSPIDRISMLFQHRWNETESMHICVYFLYKNQKRSCRHAHAYHKCRSSLVHN